MERMDEGDLVFEIVLMINRLSSSDMMMGTMIVKTKG